MRAPRRCDEADEAPAVLDELDVRQPAAAVAEERHRHERAGRHRGDPVDLAHHPVREAVHERRAAWRA